MEISNEKKKKLKELLMSIADPEEQEELKKLDSLKVKEIVSTIDEIESDYKNDYKKLETALTTVVNSFNTYQKKSGKYHENLIQSFGNMSSSLVDQLNKLGTTITTSYEKNKPVNAPGVYKDMINQIAAVNESVKNKPVPVWNWPQYAGVSVRNRNFSNIDPAVDSLNIGEYDSVAVTYPTTTSEVYAFFQNGLTGSRVATVTITYTDTTKAFITNVVKIPVVRTL